MGYKGAILVSDGSGGLNAWAKSYKMDFIVHYGDLVLLSHFISFILFYLFNIYDIKYTLSPNLLNIFCFYIYFILYLNIFRHTIWHLRTGL